MRVVETVEGADKIDGGCRQVHHKVVDGLRNGDESGRWRWNKRDATTGTLGFEGDGDCVLLGGGQGQKIVGGMVNEFVAVFAKWANEVGNLWKRQSGGKDC